MTNRKYRHFYDENWHSAREAPPNSMTRLVALRHPRSKSGIIALGAYINQRWKHNSKLEDVEVYAWTNIPPAPDPNKEV